ncbi:MAG: glycosyltransferase [Pseudomonadota bacterium]
MGGKIVFVSHSGDNTGAPIVLSRFFRWAIRSEREDVFFVFRYSGELAEQCKKEYGGERVYTIRQTSPHDIPYLVKPLSKLVDLVLLLMLFKSLKPSVVVANSLINTTALIAGLWVNAKVIVWAHEVTGAINDPFHLRGFWIKKAHAGIGVSRQSCDFLNELGLSRSKIHLIHNGFDMVRIFPEDSFRRKKNPRDLLILGALAVWSPNKRLDLAIETAIRVAESGKFSQVRLNIGGLPDPWFPNLIKQTLGSFRDMPKNLEIRIMGQIDQDKLYDFYENIDGVLLTSDKESLPTVGIEALAYQTPVFSYEDLSGAREILGDLALEAEERTGVALAGEVIHFFDSPGFAASLANWQRRALERARLFTLENQWKNFQKVFNEIIL